MNFRRSPSPAPSPGNSSQKTRKSRYQTAPPSHTGPDHAAPNTPRSPDPPNRMPSPPQNTPKPLKAIDPPFAKIWCFMTFHGDFSIFDFDFRFMKPQTSVFRNVFSYAHQYCCKISSSLVEYYWRYSALQLSLKHAFTGISWTLFRCTILYSD